MNSKFNFTTKELVKTFSYTTISQNRKSCANVNIDGRTYIKTGTLQSLTFVGNLYKDDNNNYLLCIGVAKQHPCDAKCNKQTAYETAQLKAVLSPDLVMHNVPKYITKYNFRKMMQAYEDMFDLEFIKTKKEIIALGKNPADYNR